MRPLTRARRAGRAAWPLIARRRASPARDGADARRAAAAGADPLVDRLARLADLRDRGILTEAEFQAQKAKLL